jgi:hypothetical protein
LYFGWKDDQQRRLSQALASGAGLRLKGSQLYLDDVGTIGRQRTEKLEEEEEEENSGDGSDGGRLKTETGTGRTRLSE